MKEISNELESFLIYMMKAWLEQAEDGLVMRLVIYSERALSCFMQHLKIHVVQSRRKDTPKLQLMCLTKFRSVANAAEQNRYLLESYQNIEAGQSMI